ncbi:MAG: ABC transporter permease [Saprospiraceae bacterium]
MNLINLSWKNILIKPLSTTLSLVLFALGVGIITLLMLINNQVQEKFEKNLAGVDMVVGAKGSPLQLILSSIYHIDYPTGNISLREAAIIKKHPRIAPLVEKTIPLALGDSYKTFRIVGTEHSYVELYDSAAAANTALWSKDMEVTLGAKVAKELNLKVGEEFFSAHGFMAEAHSHEESPLRIVSILPKTNTVLDQLILTNINTIRLLHKEPEIEFDEEDEEDNHKGHDDHEHHSHDDHSHNEASKEPVDMDDPKQGLTSMLVFFRTPMGNIMLPNFINQNTNMQTAAPAFETNRLYEMMGVGTDALRILAFVIIFISGLSVFISLFNSLKDRKYELALMRVMGASRLKLFFLIILEGLMIAILGYILGLLLSHGGMSIFSGAAEEAYQYSFDGWRFLKEEVYILLGALAIGIVAALIPALMVYKTDISETLGR